MKTGERTEPRERNEKVDDELTFNESPFLFERTSVPNFTVQPEDGVETTSVEDEVAIIYERNMRAQDRSNLSNEDTELSGDFQSFDLVGGIILERCDEYA